MVREGHLAGPAGQLWYAVHGAMAVPPHASHLHHLEQPELFLAVVRDHLHRSDRPADTPPP